MYISQVKIKMANKDIKNSCHTNSPQSFKIPRKKSTDRSKVATECDKAKLCLFISFRKWHYRIPRIPYNDGEEV